MKPKLLDLFCGAGGATKGYQRAGFHVTGVDIKPQPRYCGDAFIQADALEYCAQHGREYDAIHASPPCQDYMTGGVVKRPGMAVLPAVRSEVEQAGKPWVLENVPGAPIRPSFTLCGSMFGLNVRRHRHFESPWLFGLQPSCNHSLPATGVYGHPHGRSGAWKGMLESTAAMWAREMGIDWMTATELTQAIPPAYTEFIGRQLREALT